MKIRFALITLYVLIACASANASTLDDFAGYVGEIRVPAIALAREAVTNCIKGEKCAKAQSKLPEIFKRKAAVFVTISKHGRRRGCFGVFEPVTSNLGEEIIRSATHAATADKRYRPIRKNELSELEYTVSIVGPLKRVSDPESYPPECYGLLLKCASGAGVLLPGEARTNRWRIAEARRQAGAGPKERCEMFVFRTIALHESRKG